MRHNYFLSAYSLRAIHQTGDLISCSIRGNGCHASLRREGALLENLSEQVRQCYEHAEECACQAQAIRDEKLRADYLHLEQNWLKLARSYALHERLTLFSDEAARRKNDPKQNTRQQIAAATLADIIEAEFTSRLGGLGLNAAAYLPSVRIRVCNGIPNWDAKIDIATPRVLSAFIQAIDRVKAAYDLDAESLTLLSRFS
jgi:hypothetical protein